MMVSAVLCAPPYVLALEKARSEDDVTVCLPSCVYTATAVMAEKRQIDGEQIYWYWWAWWRL